MTFKTHEQIFDAVADSSITDAVYSRRDVLSRSTMGVAALALTGMPIGLATMTEQALGQAATTTDVTAALTLALRLELLERAFYDMGHASSLGFSAAETDALTVIRAHETAHVALLSAIVTGVTAGTYDFTAGGAFDPANSVTDFFAVAQLLEDTGVRAYKGQLPNLIGSAYLTTAFQLHSVEARHAAEIRMLRGFAPYPPAPDSLTGYADEGYFASQAQIDIAVAVYGPAITINNNSGNPTPSTGEDNKVQGSSYAPLPTGVTTTDATAFDEPLTAAQITTIVALFGA